MNYFTALWDRLAIWIAHAMPRSVARYAYIRIAVETQQDRSTTIRTVDQWER